MIINSPKITRRPESQLLDSMQVRGTHNRVIPMNRSLNHPTTVTTSNFVNTIPKSNATVNTIPAQNPVPNPSNDEMVQGIVNTFNRLGTHINTCSQIFKMPHFSLLA